MKSKYELVEGERDVLVDNETKLEEKVRQLTSQLEVERLAAANAIEQLEQEQCEKRELQEELNDLKVKILLCSINMYSQGPVFLMMYEITLRVTVHKSCTNVWLVLVNARTNVILF